ATACACLAARVTWRAVCGKTARTVRGGGVSRDSHLPLWISIPPAAPFKSRETDKDLWMLKAALDEDVDKEKKAA
ncbi:MAG: hypothetical protein NT018_03875, partial [Armatimonadetes bacterium]|nr:hypothetical protein [Armatimonadota bacterium]